MMYHAVRVAGPVLSMVLFLAGCQSLKKERSDVRVDAADDRTYRARNEGYNLLYSLMGDEKNVSKLLLIKRETADVGQVIKEISRAAAAAQDRLESFAKSDARLNLKLNALPVTEQKTRDSISSMRSKELLLSSGPTFELTLLLTQNEAMTYATHLAKVLGDQETVPDRRAYLAQLSEQLEKLRRKVLQIITSRHGGGS
jgi:hypothetical protein